MAQPITVRTKNQVRVTVKQNNPTSSKPVTVKEGAVVYVTGDLDGGTF
jgi:hypothetical protein